MVYKDNIPQPQDPLSESQGDILENFSQLNIVYGTDHVAYNAAADVGKHKTVTYVTQAPDPTTVAGEAKEFSKEFNTAAANPLDALHFTRGSSNAVPTPLTSFQNDTVITSIAGNGAFVNVLDLTNVNQFFALGYLSYDGNQQQGFFIRFDAPSTLIPNRIRTNTESKLSFEYDLPTTKLRIKTTTNSAVANVYYSIQFIRIS